MKKKIFFSLQIFLCGFNYLIIIKKNQTNKKIKFT